MRNRVVSSLVHVLAHLATNNVPTFAGEEKVYSMAAAKVSSAFVPVEQ